MLEPYRKHRERSDRLKGFWRFFVFIAPVNWRPVGPLVRQLGVKFPCPIMTLDQLHNMGERKQDYVTFERRLRTKDVPHLDMSNKRHFLLNSAQLRDLVKHQWWQLSAQHPVAIPYSDCTVCTKFSREGKAGQCSSTCSTGTPSCCSQTATFTNITIFTTVINIELEICAFSALKLF